MSAEAEKTVSNAFLTFLHTLEDKPFPSETTEVVAKPKDIFLLSVTFHFVKT